MPRKRERQEREEMEEKSQTGTGREVVGAERQKVRGRGVLMAVCRARLKVIWGLVGAELCVRVGGWMDGERHRWSDGREDEGEGPVVST